ncbi:helix-turn-helix domain-containing protein [Nocardia sp. alder85J]|uniref:helix-turn-helix domain-containing protein n=1 Tax=Nocardia sp. alder85J TaxID=2862949 RepID=UPI001CD266FF|nr:helix-turn-helix domain-containing protein [Nocardia sp. alder85J]MCX4096535.1 helix-turn-helix domain-containing protein [Nocardia sp. alder85J]
MPTTADDQWLTRDELAQRLKIPAKTLAVWASQQPQKGPRYVRMGKYCRYLLSDVIDWERKQFED